MRCMTKSLLRVSVLFPLTFGGAALAQDSQPREVLVRSWQRGPETISTQTLNISLGPALPDYDNVITSREGKRYKFRVIHNPITTVKTEHWEIDLREITLTSEGKEVLGDNLLLVSPPGPGKHYFPREELAGYLYPERGAPVIRVGGVPFVEGFAFYPISTTRKFSIANFCLVTRVEGFQHSSTDDKKLDYLDLIVEFQNACEADSSSSGMKGRANRTRRTSTHGARRAARLKTL